MDCERPINVTTNLEVWQDKISVGNPRSEGMLLFCSFSKGEDQEKTPFDCLDNGTQREDKGCCGSMQGGEPVSRSSHVCVCVHQTVHVGQVRTDSEM